MKKEIIALRQELHQHPEVSNKEYKTAERIVDFMQKLNPDEVMSLGNTTKMFVFNGSQAGKTIVFRAELDALPISEKNSFAYSSVNPNVGHMCGHDGHMAILVGLAQMISEGSAQYGKIVFLFQAAEEVEQGALDIVNDAAFKNISPDYIFALHNIPGFKKHQIILKEDSFSAASKGMTIKLFGKTAHAAEPENGISPADAISEIIRQLHIVRDDKNLFKDLILITIIHIQLGEISFGTSPGYAEIRVTLRSFENTDMDVLTAHAEKLIKEIAEREKLEYAISYSEVFPATVNNHAAVEFIEQAAKENNLELEYLEKPFKWSEDFGYYAQEYKSAMFGLGAGVSQTPLHNPDYDFPEEIMETGIKMFYTIYKNINKI
jgi:amidohydrolase